jgi:competence protein ComEA
MKPWQSLAFGLVVGLLLAAAVFLVSMPPRGVPIVLSTPLPPAPVTVFVDGAVQTPGLYTLPYTSRVNDAIIIAGGLLPSANTASLNLAARLKDGDKVMVPVIKDTPIPKPTSTARLSATQLAFLWTPTPAFPINLNTATLAELQELPGIGEVKARSIITYRQEHGPFKLLDELLNVQGIGPGIFASIKDLISLADPLK